MNRSIDIRKTRFVIPELYIGEEMLDKIQCNYFQLSVKDTIPTSVCFQLAINMRPTLVYGSDDLEVLNARNSDFTKLILRDESIIKRIIRYCELNTKWLTYKRLVQFTFGANESEQFECNIIFKNNHLLILKRI